MPSHSHSDTGSIDLLQDETLKGKLVRNGFWLYFFSFLVAPAGYIIKMLISRQLSVDEVGIIYSIIGLVTIVSTYHDLGLTEALQYYLPHYLIDKEYIKAKSILMITWFVQFATGILIAVIMFFLAPWLATHYFHSPEALLLLRYFCLYFLVINLFLVLQSIFIATQQVKLYNGIDAIRMRTIALFVTIMIFTNTLTGVFFARAWIAGLFIGLAFALRFFWRKFGWLIKSYPLKRDSHLLKKQRKYAIRVLLGINVGNILGQVDQQFSVFFLGPESAGYWSNYLTLLTAVNVVITPLVAYLFPLFNELLKKGQHAKVALLKKYLYIGTAILGILIAVIGRFYGEKLAIILFGHKFALSGKLFQYMAPFIWINILLSISFQYLASKGKVAERVKILGIGLLCNIILGLVFIHIIGIQGLILSTIIVWIIMYSMSLNEEKKLQKINIPTNT